MQNKIFRVDQFHGQFRLYKDALKSEKSMRPIATASSLNDLKTEAAKVLKDNELEDATTAIERFSPIK